MGGCSNCGPSLAAAGSPSSASPPTISAARNPAEIAETAQHEYAVTFPIAAKAVVVGPGAHPFYMWAAEVRPKDVPKWNFHKYLIGRDGHIAAVFPTQVEPMEARVVDAVAKELGHTS